jgi:glycosyltransferase involved in cell wall biosynthesis
MREREATTHTALGAGVAERKVKVLYVIGTLDIGGTEGQLVQLVTRLDRRYFEPVVCCLTSSGPHHRTLEAAGIPVKIIGFEGFRMFRRPVQVARELSRLVRFLRAERPAIVHAFLFWAYVIGAFAARAARVPVVIASRRSLGCFKEGVLHHLWLERLATRITDVIVANSEAVKADVVRQERVAAARVRVIHNGVDPGPPVPSIERGLGEHLGIPSDSSAVGVVARLIDYKGHRYFLQACCAVRQRHPRAVFLLVGDGPEAAPLVARVRELGLDAVVRFLGTRMDVARILTVLDVVVLPSLEEGFPNVVLEAMAAGKPVVASRVGGVPEAVVHGETGLLVPPADPQALAEAIATLLDDPARAQRMGRAGRDRVITWFGMDRMVQETERLYHEILAQAARPRPRGLEGRP